MKLRNPDIFILIELKTNLETLLSSTSNILILRQQYAAKNHKVITQTFAFPCAFCSFTYFFPKRLQYPPQNYLTAAGEAIIAARKYKGKPNKQMCQAFPQKRSDPFSKLCLWLFPLTCFCIRKNENV